MTAHKEKTEQIESILLELSTCSASLGFIGRLLIDADRRYDSALVGNVIDHYNSLISSELARLQKVLR